METEPNDFYSTYSNAGTGDPFDPSWNSLFSDPTFTYQPDSVVSSPVGQASQPNVHQTLSEPSQLLQGEDEEEEDSKPDRSLKQEDDAEDTWPFELPRFSPTGYTSPVNGPFDVQDYIDQPDEKFVPATSETFGSSPPPEASVREEELASDGSGDEDIYATDSDEPSETRMVIRGRILKFATLSQAEAAVKRVKISAEGDDWKTIEQNPYPYIVRIIEAFEKDYLKVSPGPLKPDAQWLRYQEKHLSTLKNKMRQGDQLEIAAWMLFRDVLKTHELGPRDAKEHRPDPTLKCSQRLERLIDALKNYTIFRCNVIRGAGNELFVANPDLAIKRKLENFTNNRNKAGQIAAGRNATKRSTEGDEDGNGEGKEGGRRSKRRC